jgi:hypothetical protein
LPDFSWYNIPKWGKICQMITKYTKWPKKWPNGHKLDQRLPLQDPPKFIQFRIFGLKIYRLATLERCKNNLKPVRKNFTMPETVRLSDWPNKILKDLFFTSSSVSCRRFG